MNLLGIQGSGKTVDIDSGVEEGPKKGTYSKIISTKLGIWLSAETRRVVVITFLGVGTECSNIYGIKRLNCF